jgi:hypothetical protein
MTESIGDAVEERIGRINDRNRAFWPAESAAAECRASQPALLKIAEDMLRSEIARLVPEQRQRTLEDALIAASAAKDQLGPDLAREGVREQARKGGRAGKTDALQKIIEGIVEKSPSVSGPALLEKLRSRIGGDGPICDMAETTITFEQTPGGKLKVAQLSGLKDRLSRAKKKLAARRR